jgi:D-mannonate dehydratase
MSAEYVKLTPSEQTYGEASLLQGQLSLLTMLKQYQEYESLRKEELLMKIDLKRAIGEAKESLDTLGRLLPESKFLEEQEKNEKIREEMVEKIESVVTKSKRKWEKGWTEKEPKVKEEKKVEEVPVKEEKKEPKSSLDKELDEIRQKLERLQGA